MSDGGLLEQLGLDDDPADEPPPEIHLVGESEDEVVWSTPAPARSVARLLPDFLAESAIGVRWFAGGLVVDGGLVAILGRPESFKSFGVMQLGLAGAGSGSWLDVEIGDRRPFVYVSNEKASATVRERFRTMTAGAWPSEPVYIVHRGGVTFGDRQRWGELVQLVAGLERPPFVALDTLASLAGPGFDENSGKDMAVALAGARALCDVGATVGICHHPSKGGDGTGGIRLRGHTSLWGEVDGVLEFVRPDRAVEGGMIRAEPKDGDLRLIPFRWGRDTFRLVADAQARRLTAVAIGDVVDALYDGFGVTAARIAAEFPGHGRTVLRDRIAEAAMAGLIARIGSGPSTAYVPVPRAWSADDSPAEAGDIDERARTIEAASSSGADDLGTLASSGSQGNRPRIVRTSPSSRNRPSGPGGLIDPWADDPEGPDDLDAFEDLEPIDVDDAIASTFPDPSEGAAWIN